MLMSDLTSRLLRATAVSGLVTLMLAAVSLAADPSTLTWEKLALTMSLPPRASFASAYDPISKKVVIFGGFNASNSLNETRTFDGTTWVQVKTSVAPSVRTAASMAYDQKIQKLVLFGGASGFTVPGDTWLWDGATSTWTQANPKTVPAGASGPVLFTDPPTNTSSSLVDTGVASTRAILFGGPVRTGSF
jgi:hypothetical protein